MSREPRAAYIHVPFCRHRCGYCNFTLIAGRDDLFEAYVQAVELELAQLGAPREVETLFLGGGTPTHLPLALLQRLMAAARRWLPLAVGAEVSVEANPEDIDASLPTKLAELGVTRLSLGVQSFDDAKLQVLERSHREAQIAAAVEAARTAIGSIACDLIFAAPGESLATWSDDLSRMLALAPNHISTYGLTFERGAAFYARREKGSISQLDEELERAMYIEAIERLTAAGYEHYEVSNFAKPGHRSRHNEAYWLGEEYFAFGPGAARYVGGRREVNHKSTTTYIRRMLAGESPVAESETLGEESRARERLVFGLRRLAGVDCLAFASQTGVRVESLAGEAIEKFLRAGLLERSGNVLRLTREGLLVSDALWPELL
jgi:oxygen-independent coproporphyrinogen-3 oxidase